jgi:hypothetical protein
MALAKTALTVHGLNVENAYHRVEFAQLDKNKMTFRVRSYKDNSGLPHFSDTLFDCVYDLNGENPIKQAYQHLKTMPEFAGAIDC